MFGPKVKEQLARHTPFSVVVDASRSGKLTRQYVKRWLKEEFILDVKDDSLLLLDSCTGQTDETIFSADDVFDLLHGKNIRIKVIPRKNTKFIQPFDVYFFKQYKLVIRRLEDYFRHKFISASTQEKLHGRVFFMKLHSVVYQPVCSPALKDMITYAWQKCGYVTGDLVTAFGNALETLLTVRGDHSDCS